MTHPITTLFAAGALLVAGATGCPSQPGATGGGGSDDGGATGTLIFARGADSKSLDPISVSDGESVKVLDQIYDTLVAPKATSTELEPGLATEWSTSEDRLTWTFTLRPGVKFHDGTACDAAAVKFNLDRLIDETNPTRFGSEVPYSGVYTNIASFAAPAASTLTVTLKQPSAVLLAILSIFPASIASPTAIQAHTVDYGSHPCGTGPFSFVKWDRGTKLVLQRNPDYFGEKAKVATVVFVPYAEPEARKIALERGEAHIADNLDLSMVEAIAQHPELRYEKTAGMNFAYLALNNDRAPFNDVRVRRAVAHAIDKEAILKLLTFGQGRTGANPLPPTLPSYNEAIDDYPHDIAKAKALLADAGHPNGFKTELWCMNNSRPYMPKPVACGQILKEQLRKVGIDCEIVSPQWEEYLAKTGNGEHPMCVLGWSADYPDADNFLNVLLKLAGADERPASNRSFYRNPATQQLLDEAAQISDQPKRVALYRQAQQQIHDDCPMIPLAYLPVGYAMRNEVQGYNVHPLVVRLNTVTLSAKK